MKRAGKGSARAAEEVFRKRELMPSGPSGGSGGEAGARGIAEGVGELVQCMGSEKQSQLPDENESELEQHSDVMTSTDLPQTTSLHDYTCLYNV